MKYFEKELRYKSEPFSHKLQLNGSRYFISSRNALFHGIITISPDLFHPILTTEFIVAFWLKRKKEFKMNLSYTFINIGKWRFFQNF